jgi:hypothetical protein
MRGMGHGKLVVQAYEQYMHHIAHNLGEKMIFMVLESEPRATQFWSSRGYRWVVDSVYIQPPIDYDETTGEPLYEPVEGEFLMVKVLDDPTATQLNRGAFAQILQVMYSNWYLPDYIPQEAQERVKKQVLGDFYTQCMNSLPAGDAPVPLGIPPQNAPTGS